MTQALPKPVTFAEFLEWKPEVGRYELHDGVIFEMQPTGEHEEIKGFLASELTVEFKRLKLPYFITNQALVKPPEKESSYLPDVLILNRHNLASEALWKKSSTVTQGATIPLIIEVVSTNWRDDYRIKLNEYETLGVLEYWIVDYAGLGGVQYIGSPKQPTVTVNCLIDSEYQAQRYQGEATLISLMFPQLELTTTQIVAMTED